MSSIGISRLLQSRQPQQESHGKIQHRVTLECNLFLITDAKLIVQEGGQSWWRNEAKHARDGSALIACSSHHLFGLCAGIGSSPIQFSLIQIGWSVGSKLVGVLGDQVLGQLRMGDIRMNTGFRSSRSVERKRKVCNKRAY